jgi:hypothetical protein
VIKGLVPLHEVRAAGRELTGVHEVAWAAQQRDGELPWADVGASWDVTVAPDRTQRIEQLYASDKVSPALARLGTSSAIIDVIDELMEPDQDIMAFHSKTLMRAGDAGSRFPWHQDFGYWHYTHKRPVQINCAIAIEAQTVESGCLKYVEGSHKRGMAEHVRLDKTVVSSFPICLTDRLDAYDAVPVEYEPGDGIFFGPLVIHGSDVNRTGADARFNTFAYDLGANLIEEGTYSEPLLRERTKRLHAMCH